MRFYGKNRARLLGEETEEQQQPEPPKSPKGYRTCSSCKRTRPLYLFGNGRYSTCDTCREWSRECNARKRERSKR